MLGRAEEADFLSMEVSGEGLLQALAAGSHEDPDHRAILVLRDPRDVVVLQHFYTRHHDPYMP